MERVISIDLTIRYFQEVEYPYPFATRIAIEFVKVGSSDKKKGFPRRALFHSREPGENIISET